MVARSTNACSSAAAPDAMPPGRAFIPLPQGASYPADSVLPRSASFRIVFMDGWHPARISRTVGSDRFHPANPPHRTRSGARRRRIRGGWLFPGPAETGSASALGRRFSGRRVPWRTVTSMRRRLMSSTVQPMPARATAARSMPFVFAPVDAMTLPLAFRPPCSIRGQAMRFGRPPDDGGRSRTHREVSHGDSGRFRNPAGRRP